MYSICNLTHTATSVEHAVVCHFFNRAEKSLIVAGANVIRVFRLIPDVDPSKKEKFTESRPPKMKLECLATYTLFGNVMSLKSVSISGSTRDCLLLSFQDAKLSVVEYDPEAHDLKTLSLHYFEEEEMRGGWTQNYQIPVVRVDPEARCAIMLVYGRKLVVLPFRRELTLDESDIAPDTKGGTTLSSSSGRSHVLASYMIVLKELDEKLENVIDMQFLHGYYEPTLLILYEPLKTFPGRIAVRQDTCAMVAISLNIQQKVHPIIWSVSNLPFDCTQAIAIDKPLGGTLIAAVNSIIYLNQSVPPFGVSLNGLTNSSTNFPLKVQEGVKLTLECAQFEFISPDRLVISLKNGELYVLTLYADSIRSVRSFHFEKAAASVLTTCMCLCEENYLFLGSRLGNSLLLRFTEKEHSMLYPIEEKTQSQKLDPPSKKKRLDTLGDWMASDVADIKDVDELEVYGSEAQTAVQIASYTFEVCDSLLNIGPCGNISMGEPAFLSEEFATSDEPDLELFTTSGYGKNGALCVLQRSVRPQVVTTFELPGCVDMWTVIGNKSPLGDPTKGDKELSHAFMILSQHDSTMVLQTGLEINEVDNSGFTTQGPTVYAGNIGYNKYIIQVSQMGVRLLQGLEQLQHIPLDLGSPIIHATCADPFVIILTEDGQIILLTLREGRNTAKLSITRPTVSLRPHIVTLCAYRDVSGLFTTSLQMEEQEVFFRKEMKVEGLRKEEDDEDKMLYGDPEGIMEPLVLPGPGTKSETSTENTKKSPWWQKHLQDVKPTYWMFMSRDNGNLEIYTLPDFRLSYVVRNFSQGPRVLSDCLDATPLPVNSTSNPTGEPEYKTEVMEILVVALGHHGNRPLLIVRLEDELLIYQAFRYHKGYLKLRFRRLPHNILIRDRFKVKKTEDFLIESRVSHLRYFSNIAGYNGVFICGRSPHWLFLTSRGELRLHPMWIDGPVTCFAPFHNVNCPQGFLYFNRKEELRICVLPTHLSYDAPWPVRKVPLRCTPHFTTYHLESKTYCVVTSTSEPTNRYYMFNGEDKELSIEERGERFPLPLEDKFSILLFSPVSWEIIPNTKIDLEEWEHVTCLKNVSLQYEGTTSGLKGYIAIATNYNYGEDVTSRGRILIFDIIEVVPEPGQPLTKNRFKMLYSKEQKGPVTALNHVLGFLVSAIGQKIYIWQLKDNDLVGVAFIDTNIYVHQILSIKSLILVADVFKSISLLRFQEEYRTLSLVSRDFRACEIYTAEFLLDNTHMGFLTSDREKNFVLHMYQPESRESQGGQRLIRKADFHLGQHVNAFFRIRCKLSDTEEIKHLPDVDKRHITMFATLDGALGYLLPVPEKSYRRLLMLQNVLINHVPHTAGLNPKAFRMYKSSQKLLSNPARGVIDGELIWMFFNLPLSEKHEVAKKIGTKVEEVLDELTDIERLTEHF